MLVDASAYSSYATSTSYIFGIYFQAKKRFIIVDHIKGEHGSLRALRHSMCASL